jgi:hypothetical protein
MKLYSKNQNLNLFCKWCLGEPFGLGASPFYLEMKQWKLWRKVVVGWRLWRWRSSAEVDERLWRWRSSAEVDEMYWNVRTSVSCFQLAKCFLVFFVCERRKFHVLVTFLTLYWCYFVQSRTSCSSVGRCCRWAHRCPGFESHQTHVYLKPEVGFLLLMKTVGRPLA